MSELSVGTREFAYLHKGHPGRSMREHPHQKHQKKGSNTRNYNIICKVSGCLPADATSIWKSLSESDKLPALQTEPRELPLPLSEAV